ncbi:Hypothetical predicted protein [Mytilus galloprovincialis]|nr:Hypothetical predicted protein [Mytilus galloprovincialis]
MVHTLLTNKYTKIDVSLSYKLIVQFFQLSIPAPSRKWGANPLDTEIGIGEDIERIKRARDRFVHRLNSYTSEHIFDNFFATFIEVGKRIDAFLNKSPNYGYEHAIRLQKMCALDSETEKKLLDARSECEQLKGKSTEAVIEKIKAQEEESYTKLKLTIHEVDNSDEVVKLINSLKEDLHSDNIYFKGAEKGSIIIFFDVKNRVVLDDSMFKFEVSTFIQKLFKFCNLTCYLHTHTYAIMANATEMFEQPTINLPDKATGKCFLDEKSPVDVKFEVNSKIFHSPDRLNGTLNRVFKIIVIKGNGKNLLGKGDEELGESENISTTKALAQFKDLMEMYQPQKKLISNLRNFSNATSPFLSIYVNA